MNRRPLGRTGLQLSSLCFGTLNFGWRVSGSNALALLDAFRAAGGNFIQAAAVSEPTGVLPQVTEASEEYVGHWWRDRKVPRDELFLATRLVIGGARPFTASAFESHVRRACESSLGRLRTNHLDLLLIEWRGDLPPIDEVLFSLDRLKRAGLVRYLGASGFPAWRVMDAIHRAARRNVDRFEVLQADFSRLAESNDEHEQLQLCREHRLGFLARSPLAGGLLAVADEFPGQPRSRPRRFHERHTTAEIATARDALDEIAARHRLTLAQAGLAWVLAHPGVSAPVLGVSSVEQLTPLLSVPEIILTPEEIAASSRPTSEFPCSTTATTANLITS